MARRSLSACRARGRVGAACGGALAAALVVALAGCSGTPKQPLTAPSISARGAGPEAAAESPLGSFLAGRFAYAQRDISSAARYLARALHDDPANRELLVRTFLLMIADGRYDRGLALARRVLEVDPDATLPNLVLALEDARQGRYALARLRLADLPHHDVNVLLLPLLRAWLSLGSGDPQGALRTLRPLAREETIAPYAHWHAGLIADLAGLTEAAETHYRKALSAVPGGSLRVVEALGAFYAREGRLDDARAVYDAYMERHPDTLWIETARKRLAAGTAPERPVGNVTAGLAEALFAASSALPRQNGSEAQLVYTRLALYLNPRLAAARVMIGEVLDSLDRPAEALTAYRAVDSTSGLAWTARLRVAADLNRLGRTEEALGLLARMASERPDRPDAYITMGDILRAHERFAEAVTAYDKAAARLGKDKPRHWSLYYARGVALERSHQWPRAEADFLKALSLKPDQPLVLNYLGYSWVDKGVNLKRARAMIERAVALRPNDGYIVDSLGWALYRLGDYNGAVAKLERAAELKADDPVINDHLGDAYWQVGRQVEARYQWQRALSLGPEPAVEAAIRRKLAKGLSATAYDNGES